MKYSARPAVFIINSLEGGGAERVMVKLLTIMESYFEEKTIPVHLILLDDLPESHQCPAFVDKTILKGGNHVRISITPDIIRTACSFITTKRNFHEVLSASSGVYHKFT